MITSLEIKVSLFIIVIILVIFENFFTLEHYYRVVMFIFKNLYENHIFVHFHWSFHVNFIFPFLSNVFPNGCEVPHFSHNIVKNIVTCIGD